MIIYYEHINQTIVNIRELTGDYKNSEEWKLIRDNENTNYVFENVWKIDGIVYRYHEDDLAIQNYSGIVDSDKVDEMLEPIKKFVKMKERENKIDTLVK